MSLKSFMTMRMKCANFHVLKRSMDTMVIMFRKTQILGQCILANVLNTIFLTLICNFNMFYRTESILWDATFAQTFNNCLETLYGYVCR